MIHRIKNSPRLVAWEHEWPDCTQGVGSDRDIALYADRTRLRKLRVVVDLAVLDSLDTSTLGPGLILTGLLKHSYLSLYRYDEDATPSGKATARWYEDWAEMYGEGWVTVSGDGPMGLAAAHGKVGSVCESVLYEEPLRYAQSDTSTSAYSEMSLEAAGERRAADALAAQVATVLAADIFITDRPYLYEAGHDYAPGVTLMGPGDAIPFIALYLRTQGDYLIYGLPDGQVTSKMNRGLYYRVGSYELLPSVWRWGSACDASSRASGDDRLLYLAQSALQRIQRALEARDDLHRIMNQPPKNDTTNAALSHLDVVLLLLMGAIDTTARVAHTALTIPGKIRRAGWQNSDWLKQVATSRPQLAAIVAVGTAGKYTLEILRLLRNSIHGEALRPLLVSDGGTRDRTLFGLPREDVKDLTAACAELGGQSAWGVESAAVGQFHADPGILIERLLPQVLKLLNELMDKTPVEQLPGLVSMTLPTDIPTETHRWFSEHNRLNIRWQLGL